MLGIVFLKSIKNGLTDIMQMKLLFYYQVLMLIPQEEMAL